MFCVCTNIKKESFTGNQLFQKSNDDYTFLDPHKSLIINMLNNSPLKPK